MKDVSKIILSLICALLGFLLGWAFHAWKNRHVVTKEVKQAIIDLNHTHMEVLKTLKADYEKKIEEKNKIIDKLTNIITRLIEFLEPLKADNSSIDKLIKKLKKNMGELQNL